MLASLLQTASLAVLSDPASPLEGLRCWKAAFQCLHPPSYTQLHAHQALLKASSGLKAQWQSLMLKMPEVRTRRDIDGCRPGYTGLLWPVIRGSLLQDCHASCDSFLLFNAQG